MGLGRVATVCGCGTQGRVQMKALAQFDAFPDEGAAGQFRLMGRALVLDALHRREEARAELATLESSYGEYTPYFVGVVYAAFGDADRAYAYFDRAIEIHDVSIFDIVSNPWQSLATVRADPRFPVLLRKMGIMAGPADGGR